VTMSDRAAPPTSDTIGASADQTKRSDRTAWAAGEWAIVGARLPAKRARARQHDRPVRAKPAAWAAGEWAMPDADTNEGLD
jgi:hypothetical protein